MADELKNVLIVDGEKLSGLISKMLEGDFTTDVAHNGLNAVQKLREVLPQAIVVEVDILPGMGSSLRNSWELTTNTATFRLSSRRQILRRT